MSPIPMQLVRFLQKGASWFLTDPVTKIFTTHPNLLVGMLMTVLGAVLASCASLSPLTIASHVWPGYEFIFHAQREGWLGKHKIQLLETANASKSLKALADGRVDGATLTMDEVLRAREQGIPLTIILLLDISAGADVLLANPALKNLSDLKGKRIGVETSALGGLMLNRVLQAAPLSHTEVTIIPITLDEHLSTWQAGGIDAIITYEPVAHQIEAGGAARLFDSRQLPNTIFDVLVVRSDIADTHAQQLKTLVAAHFQALHAWKTNPIDTAYRFSRHLQVTSDKIPILFRGLELPDVDYNRRLLNAPSFELYQVATETAAIMSWQKPTEHLFRADYLPETGS